MDDQQPSKGIASPVEQTAATLGEREEPEISPGHHVLCPVEQSLPMVFSSPHSGRRYPERFLAQTRLDPVAIRRSEDSFVERLFSFAPEIGAPLIHADFPRAFVDPNREPWELDPSMFSGPLPGFANTRSPRVAAGLGTIARVVANGAEIYRDKLDFADAQYRIETYYWPYHRGVRALIERTLERFGYCLFVDCHSMASASAPLSGDPKGRRMDMILGDAHGTTCHRAVTDHLASALEVRGYRVGRNDPYAGGFLTRHYGHPSKGVHAIQIEINRALYMDEARLKEKSGLKTVSADLRAAILDLARLPASVFGG